VYSIFITANQPIPIPPGSAFIEPIMMADLIISAALTETASEVPGFITRFLLVKGERGEGVWGNRAPLPQKFYSC